MYRVFTLYASMVRASLRLPPALSSALGFVTLRAFPDWLSYSIQAAKEGRTDLLLAFWIYLPLILSPLCPLGCLVVSWRKAAVYAMCVCVGLQVVTVVKSDISNANPSAHIVRMQERG